MLRHSGQSDGEAQRFLADATTEQRMPAGGDAGTGADAGIGEGSGAWIRPEPRRRGRSDQQPELPTGDRLERTATNSG